MMKRRILIGCVLSILLSMQLLQAQPMAALQQSGETTFFSGNESFREAYAAASDGAIIYLSGGTFLVPDTIAKSISVFGVGHYPEYTSATGPTKLSEPIILAAGAGESYFEGFHLTERLAFVHGHRIDDVVFRRCRIDGQINYGSSISRPEFPSNTLFTECILTNTSGHTFGLARNIVFANSIIFASNFTYLNYGLIENCLLLGSSAVLNTSNHTFVINCVIANPQTTSGNSGNNSLFNNVFLNMQALPAPGTNTYSKNYLNVGRENFFTDQQGNFFDYSHDFHLQSPAQYMGTDGTQVGIYGGMQPFKEGSVPIIPHVVSKKISHAIDAEGKLQVEIEVSAQDH